MNKKKILNIVIFTVIMAAAIFLRLLYLHTDLWYDEACSWFTAKQSFPSGIMENLLNLDLQHTPLYFFLLHFWMKIFGQGELAMRSLSLIFGVLTVPLAFIFSKKIMSEGKALFISAIICSCPLLVIFSDEIRMYPVVIFLVVLALNYLVDFEKNGKTSSLIKLVITNLLIPYTFVGGIFYNISVLIFYGKYLKQNKQNTFKKYLKYSLIEWLGLIPYFVLVIYYSMKRSYFVISHEGELKFAQIVDVIRNFFGANVIDNIYWPAQEPYTITLLFTVLAVIPAVYFIYGLIQGWKSGDKFFKTLYNILFSIFIMSVIFAMFKINVMTSRYILYLLPPLFIMAAAGLFNKLSDKHCKIFLTLFITASTLFTYYHTGKFETLKTQSFKTVKLESDRLGLGVDDVVIMPFGADAPYYFRQLTSPRVFDFDFHKEVRNPFNKKFYDKKQMPRMLSRTKSQVLFEEIKSDKIFSEAYFKYFTNNVNRTVPAGRYVLLAMYGSDANYLVPIADLEKEISNVQQVDLNYLEILFKKYLCDTRVMLDLDFNFLGSFTRDNYTFLLYQKR